MLCYNKKFVCKKFVKKFVRSNAQFVIDAL